MPKNGSNRWVAGFVVLAAALSRAVPAGAALPPDGTDVGPPVTPTTTIPQLTTTTPPTTVSPSTTRPPTTVPPTTTPPTTAPPTTVSTTTTVRPTTAPPTTVPPTTASPTTVVATTAPPTTAAATTAAPTTGTAPPAGVAPATTAVATTSAGGQAASTPTGAAATSVTTTTTTGGARTTPTAGFDAARASGALAPVTIVVELTVPAGVGQGDLPTLPPAGAGSGRSFGSTTNPDPTGPVAQPVNPAAGPPIVVAVDTGPAPAAPTRAAGRPDGLVHQGQTLVVHLVPECRNVTSVLVDGAARALADLDAEGSTFSIDSSQLPVGTHLVDLACTGGVTTRTQVLVFQQNGAARGEAASVILAGGLGLASAGALIGLPGLSGLPMAPGRRPRSGPLPPPGPIAGAAGADPGDDDLVPNGTAHQGVGPGHPVTDEVAELETPAPAPALPIGAVR